MMAATLTALGAWLGAEWNRASPPTDEELLGGLVIQLNVRLTHDGSARADHLGSVIRDWHQFRYSDSLRIRGWRLFVRLADAPVADGRFVIREATEESAIFVGGHNGVEKRLVRVEGEPETLVSRLRAWVAGP